MHRHRELDVAQCALRFFQFQLPTQLKLDGYVSQFDHGSFRGSEAYGFEITGAGEQVLGTHSALPGLE